MKQKNRRHFPPQKNHFPDAVPSPSFEIFHLLIVRLDRSIVLALVDQIVLDRARQERHMDMVINPIVCFPIYTLNLGKPRRGNLAHVHR